MKLWAAIAMGVLALGVGVAGAASSGLGVPAVVFAYETRYPLWSGNSSSGRHMVQAATLQTPGPHDPLLCSVDQRHEAGADHENVVRARPRQSLDVTATADGQPLSQP